MERGLSPPGVERSLPPRLHEMDEYRFQRLVTELLFQEPEVATSDEYGVRGQADDGADVIARRRQGDGLEIASCKRYERTSPAMLRDWSDEFLEHWDEHWRDEDVRRFVLATTTTNVSSRTVQDQVALEKARFAALGVDYEVWGPATIVAKMRPHRAIASTYLDEEWALRICGPAGEPVQTGASVGGLVSSALIGQLSALQGQLSANAVRAVERAQEDLRSGRIDAVRALIAEQRREEQWSQLEPHAQARLLRLAASLALRDNGVDMAAKLSGEADAIAAPDEPRLAAHVALERSGAAAALEVLGAVTTPAGLQLRIALRALTGDVEGARSDLEELLSHNPDDAETIRMEALVALASRDPVVALGHMQRAEAVAPGWSAVRQLGAMARYACALSPALDPEWYLSPNAFDSAFVREDLRSQALLGEALGLLDRLVEAEPEVVHHRIWRLAVLASMKTGRDRAHAEAVDLLVRSHHDPAVVAWCLLRGMDVDFGESQRALASRYAAGTDQSTVRVLGLLLARADDLQAAAGTLRSALDRQSGDARVEAVAWVARLESADDPGVLDDADPTEAALRLGRTTGDWTAVDSRLQALLACSPPDPAALPLAEAAASAGSFEVLGDRLDALLAFRTPTGVRIAAHAAYRTGHPARALEILDAEASAFGGDLPPDMRRLRADALARTGDIPAALREADRVAGSGTAHDRLFRAEIMTSTGNVRAAAPAVREAFDAGLLDGDRAYSWSRLMVAAEPDLARRLLEHAVSTDLGDGFVASAMRDAMGMRLDAQAEVLMARVQALAAAGAGDVLMLTTDDIPSLLAEQRAQADEVGRLLLDGVIPIHLALAHDTVAFALLHLGNGDGAGSGLRPWPIRHGGRPSAVHYDIPWSSWRLHMDVTALLVAARLQLFDAIEGHPLGVAIPTDVPLLLLAMENGCRAGGDATVGDRILAAGVRPAGIDGRACLRVIVERPAIEEGGTASTRSFAWLVEALVARRVLAAEVAEGLVRGMAPSDGEALPRDGDAILLDARALQRLAAVDALSATAAIFDIRCDGDLLDAARVAHQEAGSALRAADVLADLRERIARGLETGTFRFLPSVGHDADDEADTPITQCLRAVISAPAVENGIAWIDDRMTTGYVRTTNMPVAGVADVLQALLREGRITLSRHDAALAELRAAGALFMVPTAEEVTGALLAAPRHGQSLIESPGLAVIRRSIALVATLEPHLAVGARRPTDRPDEVVPLQAGMRLLPNCLQSVWLDDNLDFDARIACSDWLWLNARRTHVGRVIQGEDIAIAQRNFETIQLAHCLDQGIHIGLPNDSRRSVRNDYLNWLWFRTIMPLARVDDTLIPRIARYLADLYASMARYHDGRKPRDRRILRALLARRVHRLPEPVQAELYGDPRMVRFGRASESVKVANIDFEPEAFWREMRRALRYGSGRLRVLSRSGRRRRFVRLRREGDHVVLSGAVSARIGDSTLRLVSMDADARGPALESFLTELRLPTTEAARIRNEATEARSARQLGSVLRDARQASAAARYDDIAAKLARRERFHLEALAPAPFAAVLASAGLHGTDLPFREALAFSRVARDLADPVASFVETAGIPTLRGEDAHPVAIDALIERARTPLAIVHAMAGARAIGRSDVEMVRLTERLAASVERAGSLFAALLRWTQRLSLRDAEWRAAPSAYALAAIWCHADRVLDLVLGAQLAPDPLRRSLEAADAELSGTDLLRLQPAGAPDVAWPAWISPAALIHHALGAVFGDEDLRSLLGDPLMDRLGELQLSQMAGLVVPEARLLLRSDAWPNEMGSFLAILPRAFSENEFDRVGIRSALVDNALAAIEASPEEVDAWVQLGGFAAGGIAPAAVERLGRILRADVARLVRLVANGADRTLWRTVIQPIALTDPGEGSRLARELALACRWLDQARSAGAQLPVSPDDAVEELVELASIIAACSGEDRNRAFADLLDGYSQAWPALRPILHQTVGNLTAHTPSGRAGELWRIQNILGSR